MNNILKEILVVVILAALTFITFGCNQADETNNVEKSTYVDTLGREVHIPQTPQKIISLSPAITEILFALDLGEKIVGTTEFCDYPEAAKAKPKIGNFENPNLELIVASEPDLIFVAAGIQTDLITKFEELGLSVFCLDAETIEQVLKNINLTGKIMGVEAKAKQITSDMEAKVQTITEKAKNLDKPLVFFEVWDSPLMSAGPGTFINDMIHLAGGVNFAKDAKTRYPQISFERLVEENPDVYLTIAHQKQDKLENRPNYQSLKAVQKGRVYAIEDDLVTLPGPRIVQGLEKVAEAIHPEIFKGE